MVPDGTSLEETEDTGSFSLVSINIIGSKFMRCIDRFILLVLIIVMGVAYATITDKLFQTLTTLLVLEL